MAYETKLEFRTGNWSLKWIKFFLFMTNLMFVVGDCFRWVVIVVEAFVINSFAVYRSAGDCDRSCRRIGVQKFHQLRR